MLKHLGLVFLCLLGGLGMFPDPQDAALKRYEFTSPHMGTTFRVVLYTSDEKTAKTAADAAFKRIAELDGIMSDYKSTSELMQLCKKAGGEPVPVSDDLFKVLTRALEISRITDGAFDITVGPVVRLWRLARRTMMLPAADDLARARALVGYQNVVLHAKDRTVALKLKGMQLDLGGIAKGYAARAALEVLRQHGIRHALVAGGGDIVVGDAPPGAAGWRIGIAPLENPNAKPQRYLSLKNAAVSTSGDAEQYVEIGGKRYSHIVDPKTGLGLTTRMSVTVIATDGKTSDGLATGMCVLGPERGLPIIEKLEGAAALFVIGGDKGPMAQASKRFANYQD